MSLLGTREHYKPFDDAWMFDYYVLQNQMHWMPESVPLHTPQKPCTLFPAYQLYQATNYMHVGE